MKSTTFTFQDHEGIAIHTYKWEPEPTGKKAKAVVQIAHGMREHAGRYAQTAADLTAAGYIVYADDHRGHGQTGQGQGKLGDLGKGGWPSVVLDLRELSDRIQHEHPGLPLFLLGHSWGSFLAQAYIQRYGNRLQGVVLSGTNGGDPLLLPGVYIAKLLTWLRGANSRAGILEMLSDGSFNKGFTPAKTGHEWLSRDEQQVQKFTDDSLCGVPFPKSFYLELLLLLSHIWKKSSESRIPHSLPIYLFAGSEDPVGKRTQGVLKLIQRYRDLGIQDLSHRFYPGGRHEMLNEINRQEVVTDLLKWLDSHLD